MSAVVSDTSPLRALHHLRLTQLLAQIYGDVLVPPGVASELRDPSSALPVLDCTTIPGVRIVAPSDRAQVQIFLGSLDQGESEAIALAIEVNTSILLVGELAARAVAVTHGLTRVGVLGILVAAKDRGLIAEVRPQMDKLRAGIRFYISTTVYTKILELAGEQA